MEIPFLKNKNKNQGSSTIVEVERQPDSDSSTALLEGVAEELLAAIERKDFKGIKEGLKAFIAQIKE